MMLPQMLPGAAHRSPPSQNTASSAAASSPAAAAQPAAVAGAPAAIASQPKAASPYRHPAAADAAPSPGGSQCDRGRPFVTLADAETSAAKALGYTAASWDGGLVPPGCCNSVRRHYRARNASVLPPSPSL